MQLFIYISGKIHNIKIQMLEDTKMSKNYSIEVDCANCANKMEQAANKVEGIVSATVNFMTQKMHVDFAEGSDEKKVMKAVLKA